MNLVHSAVFLSHDLFMKRTASRSELSSCGDKRATTQSSVMDTLPADMIGCIALACDAHTFRALSSTCRRAAAVLLRTPSLVAQAKQTFARCHEQTINDRHRRRWYALPNGEPHGIDEVWNATGVRTSLAHYSDGNRHGTHESWNDAGIRTTLVHYVNDKEHGTYECWNGAGVRIYLAHYVNGMKHGTEESWIDSGVRTRLVHYVDGKLWGTYECWNNVGVRTQLVHYVDDKQHGTYERWNDAGVCIELVHLVDGKNHDTVEY